MDNFRAFLVVTYLGLTACAFPRPADVPTQVAVQGVVRGLWNGTNGVTLQLTSDGVDAPYTVASAGAFAFPVVLSSGVLYAVRIVANPNRHICSITSGGNGVSAADNGIPVVISCKGPDLGVHLSAPEPWTFDPTLEVQPPLAVSVLRQNLQLTIDRTPGIVSARVAGQEVSLGAASTPLPLSLGMTRIPVDVATQDGLTNTYQVTIDRGGRAIKQALYGKASNTGVEYNFGWSVAISGDTLVVGSSFEPSSSTGVNQDQNNQNAQASGAVYVFQRDGTRWTQQAYIKASNTGENDQFGWEVAISGDTLAVSALTEDGDGINGDQGNNGAMDAGAVYVFQRTGATWVQQAYLKASNTGARDAFGKSIALSGNTLAVGAPLEDSDGSFQTNNSATNSGAVYVFQRIGSAWFQQAYLKASNIQAGAGFGNTVSLEGDTLAVGAPGESSGASGVNGNSANTSTPASGAAYIFHRSGTGWAQEAYIKASNPGQSDGFGAVALSGDTLAVGAVGEASRTFGIDGDQSDDSASLAGAVYVFTRAGTTWAQQAYIKSSNTEAGDLFGGTVALNGDILAVGATSEDSASAGINSKQMDNGDADSGAVYVFRRSGTVWTQEAYIKASNPDANDTFGFGIAVSQDTLFVGGPGEGSIATGIDGTANQLDNSAFSAGAVYIFQ